MMNVKWVYFQVKFISQNLKEWKHETVAVILKYHHKGYSMNYKDTSQNGSLCILDLEWHIIILTEWQACLWNILNDVFLFNWSKMLYRKSSRFQFRFLFMYIRAQLICSDCMWEELLAQYQDTCIIHHTLYSL